MVSVFAAPHSGQVMVELKIIAVSYIGVAEIEQDRAEQQAERGRATHERTRALRAGNAIGRLALAPQRHTSAQQRGRGERRQWHAVGGGELRAAAEPCRSQAGTREQDWQRAARGGAESRTEASERQR